MPVKTLFTISLLLFSIAAKAQLLQQVEINGMRKDIAVVFDDPTQNTGAVCVDSIEISKKLFRDNATFKRQFSDLLSATAQKGNLVYLYNQPYSDAPFAARIFNMPGSFIDSLRSEVANKGVPNNCAYIICYRPPTGKDHDKLYYGLKAYGADTTRLKTNSKHVFKITRAGNCTIFSGECRLDLDVQPGKEYYVKETLQKKYDKDHGAINVAGGIVLRSFGPMAADYTPVLREISPVQGQVECSLLGMQ